MKKTLTFILAFATVCTMSVMPVAATDPTAETIYTVEYDLSELVKGTDMSTLATDSTVTKVCPQMKASTSGTGLINGKGILFKLSVPSTAKIKNVQIFQPNKNNTSLSPGVAMRTFQITYAGFTADVDYRVIDKPSLAYPCNTTAFNSKSATGDWQIGATANVLTNLTGSAGFTINGVKLIVTYTT